MDDIKIHPEFSEKAAISDFLYPHHTVYFNFCFRQYVYHISKQTENTCDDI